MKNIVEKILQEEKTAGRLIEESKLAAENMLIKARKDAESLMEKAMSDSAETAEKMKEDAEAKFLSEKEKMLQETKDLLAKLNKDREKNIPDISRRVFQRIVNI